MNKTCASYGTTNQLKTRAATPGGNGEYHLRKLQENPFPKEHTLFKKRNQKGRAEVAAQRRGPRALLP